jgi:hypothetical protein
MGLLTALDLPVGCRRFNGHFIPLGRLHLTLGTGLRPEFVERSGGISPLMRLFGILRHKKTGRLPPPEPG